MVLAALPAQHGSITTNPFTSPRDRAAGARLFESRCASCHGRDGTGSSAGSDLTTGTYKQGSSDEALFRVITKGVPGTAMVGTGVSGAEVWRLITFLRSLPIEKGAERAPGDPAKGARLFEQSGCTGCHAVGGKGGFLGPDLSEVGARRSLAQLGASLADPNAEVSPDYWSLRARTKTGQTAAGLRLNEDADSVQWLDAEGRLRSARKADLASWEIVRTSPMPTYQGKLAAGDRENLIAYLASLRKPAEAAVSVGPPLVTSERLLRAAQEPHNWLTYNGTYQSTHYSSLTHVNARNVSSLELKWVWQTRSPEKFEATPLVVDGVLYVTEPPNTVVALDARSGRAFWIYRHPVPEATYVCCGNVNRGLALLGNTLYLGTLDARLIALDAATGRKKWDVKVAEYTHGYALALAPLAVKDKIIVGPAGGERGILGFLAAYDARDGRQLWKFHTIPHPGEPGHDTWKNDAWKTGGGSIWVTGSYDPETNLTFWGIGNPGPDWNPAQRPGDNLYTDCVVALDADTGQLKWYYQFTPHDEWDWDAVQVPVLADITWKGKPRKAMLWGNRNGFFYVLDRTNGEFLLGKPFVKQTWAAGIDEKGRPIKIPGQGPSLTGTLVWPGVQGGTNWYAPSFSPRTQLFYLTAWEDYSSIYFAWDQEYEPGQSFTGGTTRSPIPPITRDPFLKRNPADGYGVVRALNPQTGEKVWEYRMQDVSDGGLLATAADLLFSGNREGYFFALEARTGKPLWRRYLGGQVAASPITYAVDGKQYVSIAAGNSLFTFGLPD
jgi:alcohol dehydrogenase (cytochrome c)